MIRSLSLTNFRSYKSIELNFEDNLTVISGPNAVGKTNLLESIFVASTTKSFRSHDADLVNTEEEFFRVVAQFDKDLVELSLSHQGGSQAKRLKLNGKKQSLHSLLGRNPVTLFEPHDMNLFDGSPDQRRRYMDTVLCQLSPGYMIALAAFKRILRQRNSLLHQAKLQQRRVSEDELFVWDVQLSQPAEEVSKQRQDVITRLSPIIHGVYSEIAGSQTQLELMYEPSVDTHSERYIDVLTRNHGRDAAAGFTTSGPHRDDMRLDFKTGDITSTASRGETRTIILALKIAEMRLLQESLKLKPILLLDDVFSELDAERRKHLMELIATQQTLLTTTEVDKNIPKNSYIIDLSGLS
jgi:DNA replication and repair protein RecF